jgi:murein DD-endopeptidase MepM/ murein hydrolase activator NlpD
MNRIPSLSLLWILALPFAPAVPTLAQAQGPTYVVQSGDSCGFIAASFGVSLDEIIRVNGLDAACLIHPGDRLILPGLEGIAGIIATKTVDLGENYATLSLRYGMTRDALYRLNHVVNPERMMAGQPVVVTEPEDGSPGETRYETGRVLSTSLGTPLVALAAAAGRNPWELAALNGLSSMADQFSGQTVIVTGGETPLRAWPDGLNEVRFRSLPLVQGSTEEISLAVPADAQAEGYLGDWLLRFRDTGSGLVALQGIDVTAAPGNYLFSVRVALADGRTITYQQDVSLVRGVFNSKTLNVPNPETLDPAIIQADYNRMRQVVTTFSETRYWQNLFVPPFAYGYSDTFGTWRSYNGGLLVSQHRGVDFYAKEKAPILAPAAGRVAFTAPDSQMEICGNTVVLDHGWGVFTRYCHLSEIRVQAEEIIQAGQEIGLVGRTGRADGPHLHWEVWVGGVQVDPEQWLHEVFP